MDRNRTCEGETDVVAFVRTNRRIRKGLLHLAERVVHWRRAKCFYNLRLAWLANPPEGAQSALFDQHFRQLSGISGAATNFASFCFLATLHVTRSVLGQNPARPVSRRVRAQVA